MSLLVQYNQRTRCKFSTHSWSTLTNWNKICNGYSQYLAYSYSKPTRCIHSHIQAEWHIRSLLCRGVTCWYEYQFREQIATYPRNVKERQWNKQKPGSPRLFSEDLAQGVFTVGHIKTPKSLITCPTNRKKRKFSGLFRVQRLNRQKRLSVERLFREAALSCHTALEQGKTQLHPGFSL